MCSGCHEVKQDAAPYKLEPADEIKLSTALKRAYPHGHPDYVELTMDELELYNDKNEDYTKGGDTMGNFNRVSAIKRLYPQMDWSSPVGVALGYMLKQLDAAFNMLSQGYEGKVEGVDKRLRDTHIYIKIARILLKESKEKGNA